MGTLRVFLALTVCINHFLTMPAFRQPYLFGPGGRLAVEIFFIISGFYMALILSGKYAGPGGTRLFFTNRVLRLYPTYLLLVGFFVAFSLTMYFLSGRVLFSGPILDWFARVPLLVRVWGFAANLFIFGQDALFITSTLPDGTLCMNCPGSIPGFMGLIIPQAWSVEVEFLCYLLAPLLVTWRTRTLAVPACVLIAGKMVLYLQPGVDEFWAFRFPPAGLALFLLGILAFRFYERHKDTGLLSGRRAKALCAAFWAYLFAYPYLPGEAGKTFVAIVFAFAAIPALFSLSRNNAFDREFGELSYPIYLVHNLVFIFCLHYISRGWSVIPWALAITLVLSYAIHRFFQGPIERYRQSRVRTA